MVTQTLETEAGRVWPAAATVALARQAPTTERRLRVRVDNLEAKGEMLRVNVSVSLAEKVLPTINNDKLHNGKVTLDQTSVKGVDLRALLDAVRTMQDGELVTVQGNSGDVRLAKQADYQTVHVRENNDGSKQRVEVRVPLKVVEALLSTGDNELDLVAAVRALAAHGDTELVAVKDEKSTVRIWLDAKSTAE